MSPLETEIPIDRQWLDLSLAQRAVWLDASLSDSPTAYVLVRWARLEGEIDPALAKQALDLMVARHDALRLRADSESPRQWLHSSSDAPFSVVDFSAAGNSEQALDDFIKSRLNEKMPLGDHWLFSLDLVKVAARSYYLFMRCHHLLADEAAVSMILQHWVEGYRALTSDSMTELAPPSSYVPVIASDIAYLESSRYKQDLDYWLARFKTLSPPLVEFRARDVASVDGMPIHSDWEMDAELYSEFSKSCATAGVTSQRAIFALFAVVLGQRYGRSDITIGMALHRRDITNLHVLGMLAGTIPVRHQLAESATILDTVREVSRQIDKDLRHQKLPIDALSRELGISRSGLSNLFQVAFSFLPSERGPMDIPLDGVKLEVGGIHAMEASPLTMHARELQGKRGIAFDITSHPDFVDAAELSRLMQLFELCVRQFIEDPDVEVESWPGVTEDERKLVITDWNSTKANYPTGRAESFFRQRAAQTPDALAVISATESVTYKQLDERSNQLADLLLKQGLMPQSVVGVALERSVATIVSLLAILKSGCIYLPLDPSYPSERLAYMLADSDAKLLITNSDIAHSLSPAIPRLCIDELSSDAVFDLSEPASSYSDNDVAYIIYTSGSTGKPKGVAVPHSAAVNLAFARLGHDPISTGDRILAAISVGFDVSIGQLLLPLLGGATIVVAGDLRSLTPDEFWEFVQTYQVTHVNSVPSFFESILEAAPKSCSLLRLMLGGEPLSATLVQRLRKALPRTQVINMYGPTEACIDATFYAASGLESAAVLPIGRPLPNYRAYLLNERLEPVGIGIPGDLYLAGSGLAHAYIRQPALTAERFIADPFGGSGQRLYKTGDRARWRSDGNIEFLGRADTQVKIRGHRIELGEIEAALALHPSVSQSAVIASTDKQGTTRLVGYVVSHGGMPAPETSQLRSHLSIHVPEYMIPSAFCNLPALPLTANGKLDQRALPPVDWQSDRIYVSPESKTEIAIAGIFAELLGIEKIGRSDNLFELGGHSLMATRLVSQLRSEFNTNVPLRKVFEQPTVEAIARYVDGSFASKAPAFVAPARPELLPLSYTQERLWFLSQLQKDDTYNVPIAVRLRGKLDVDRAISAITSIVERHEALRTCILMHEGRPIQSIQELSNFKVQTADLTALNHPLREAALLEQVGELAHKQFDLAAELPITALIATLAEDDHVIAAVVHHAVFDGWSANLFFREFGLMYAGSKESLPALKLQYADFALWQRQQDFTPDVTYWKDTLASAPPLLEFPADKVSADLSRRSAGTVPVALDDSLHKALLALANAHGASLFMVLHAAFAALLARWSGQNDVVIGTVVANRALSEFEPLIGCFVNTLALRTQIQSSQSFAQLLQQVREHDLAAYEHQGVPFERLVDELQPERSLSHTPIFQVMLVLQNEALESPQLPGLNMQPLALEPGVAKFNLTLNLAQQTGPDPLTGSFEYAADLYEAASIQRFADQFKRLLRLIAENASAAPLALDLLTAVERQQLTSDWNATSQTFPTGRAEYFLTQQAAQHPDSLAVLSATESLTYQQLDKLSNQLSHLLVARGVTPQSVIGVALERSVATVVSIAAILKAGGIYLPLDPAYPSERLAHMLSDSGARLVITNASVSDSVPVGVERIFIDNPETLQNQPASPLPARTSIEEAAYIIYTSGSTGKPKGVAVPHRAAVNLAFARLGHDPITTGDRILAAISVGFDVSIGQLLLPLLNGATIVIAGDLRSMSAAEFWQFIDSYQVTHINSVPSFFESILDAAPALCSLKRLMLGGEPLTSALVRRLRHALPNTQVVNMYGPTEACIDATFYPASGDETAAALPIGKPLANYRAYILNDRLDAVGIGIAGDLYLAGTGLAHAYINQPALTAERFIADPFSSTGERIYKTGDRARWSADGNIEFLGRADTQVKIRGHRIELGEIEAQVIAQPGVKESAVIVREDVPGDQRLVAYYTADHILSADSLRSALSLALPFYMVPAAYVRLDSLPLTANGKLDRKALPLPDAGAFAIRQFEPPQGDAEQRIARIFSGALKVEQVGRHDNFFELGGHSLLAMTVIEAMRADGLNVDVRHLFTSPTVAGLASALSGPSDQIVVPPNGIQPGTKVITPEMLPLVKLSQAEIDSLAAQIPGGMANIQDIYPLAPLQEGILFHHLMSKTGDAYLTPFLFGFDQRERLDSFLEALRDLVNRHDILRTAVLWENVSKPLQIVLRSVMLPVEEVKVAVDTDVALHLRQKYDPQHFRIDVRQAPMMRAYISQDPLNNRWLLLLMSHHLILDHTSMEIILHEAGLISSGHRALLPEATPFRDFVAQARLGISQQEHETYFRNMLGDIQETTAPYELMHVEGNGEGIREFSLTLDSAIGKRIRERARLLGVGPATLFHLAWSLVLSHIADRRDVVFGTLLLGRLQSGSGSQRTLGLFINTLPIRLRIDGGSVESAVRTTHQQLAELIRHENASLALAQRCSGVPAPTPLFSSLFNFRQSPPVSSDGSKTVLPGVELVFAQERTDYPIAIAIDDQIDKFSITAQSDQPVDPAVLCRYMETAVLNLLSALENNPALALHRVSILPARDREEVVSASNQTNATYPLGTLDELFDKQAQQTPDALAVVSATESLTYSELHKQAELLSNQLVANGVSPQTVVGVALQRSPETVVSIMAILKAGAIYLPLDPAYPADRLAYMISDSGAKLLVCNNETAPLLPDAVNKLNLDLPATAPVRKTMAISPAFTAYIIYTSGSTGKPKGVAVPHSAAVNLAYARQPHDPISIGDRVLAAISVGFDVSIGQLLLPLLSGATIVIAGDLRTLAPQEFWNFLQKHQVSHINSVPSFFESILDAAPESSSLSRLMLGGEALTPTLVRRLKQALPRTQVVNMYGPTEACIDATCYISTGAETVPVLPIGKPLPNYRAYILNDFLDPVGVGVSGDLYLGGSGLAHAYINQPQLTAERFIADPFGAPGQRLYKTGDRARWNADGNIEFLGRADTQVKIRGHRIELGEIESALLLHSSVAQTVVIAESRQSGSARLVAYVVLKKDSEHVEPKVLQEHLSAHLPDYMVPALFITLPALPLTQNGKVDLKALPKPGLERASDVAYVAPSTETEIAMEQLWQQVLGVERIGVHDDFFALGGHSLAVMRLISSCNAHFKTNLALRSLFDNPTIAKLSSAIDNKSYSDAHPSLVSLRPSGTRTPLFCIHPAGGAVLRYVPLTNALSPDQPVYGLQARALQEGEPLGSSTEEMAADYIVAMKSVQPSGPYQMIGWSSGGMLGYEIAQQLKRMGETVSFLGLLDTSLPDPSKKNPSEGELMHAFASTFGYDDLLNNPNFPENRTELQERIFAANRLPQGLDFPQFKRFYAVFCNTLTIYPHYEPAPWDGPFILFRALKRNNPMPDWSGLVGANAVYIDLDCTHADLPSETIAPILAKHMEPLLHGGNNGKQN